MANCTRLERAQCQHGAYCETFSVHDDPNECWKLKQQQPQNPMTNADRIRATDDELATMLHAVKLGYKPWCDYHCENEGDGGCDNCIKKWLQQPSEGDA